MSLHLYDSAARALREFVPLESGRVGIYLCGATVQGEPHIGHLRSALAFDVVVRWLWRSGYEVTLVRNVTDIDDKILAKAAAAGQPWWAWAYRFEREFDDAYRAVGLLPPTYSPRATGHVPEMIALVQRLLERGHAYLGDPGNVWFDVRSLADYGSLTRQDLANMLADPDPAPDKRDPHDFALWKAAKPGEPETAAWDTPFGRGRPGWHLECSAMAQRYLGETFDIHAGGIDLRFPHHENEQAQSHAAGYGFAQYWLHNAWVTSDGEKMSKSLGNYLATSAVLGRASAAVVRFALVSAHYRSTVEFSDAALTEAGAIWGRLAGFVGRASELVGYDDDLALAGVELPVEFVAAMDDDVNVAAALAAVHETVRRGNTALAAGDRAGDGVLATALAQVRAMLDVFGLDPLAEPWRSGTGGSGDGSAAGAALASLVEYALDERAEARAAKEWTRADAVRDRLASAGITVEDGADGARWSLGSLS